MHVQQVYKNNCIHAFHCKCFTVCSFVSPEWSLTLKEGLHWLKLLVNLAKSFLNVNEDLLAALVVYVLCVFIQMSHELMGIDKAD